MDYHGGHFDQTVLRSGTGGYGEYHIKIGGKYGHTYNHETTSYAKTQWNHAMDEGPKASTSWGGEVYSYHYKTPGGRERIMCVIVDRKDYGGWGERGIVTAFWVDGWSRSTTSACLSDE